MVGMIDIFALIAANFTPFMGMASVKLDAVKILIASGLWERVIT